MKSYGIVGVRKCCTVMAVSLSLLIGSGCSSDHRSRKEHRQEDALAVEYGREAALRLADVTDTIEMERILIDVRVRETTLRNRGEEKLADKYVETFLNTLDSVNPSLRAELR